MTSTNMALTEEQIQDLETTFDIFDIDQDGQLSKDEAALFIRSIGANPTLNEIDEIFTQINGGESEGTISREEFKEWMIDHAADYLEDVTTILDAFRVFDKDENGYLSREEFTDMMTNCGEEPLTEEELDNFMQGMDRDGDGRLYYKEYLKLNLGVYDMNNPE